ncbi:hypothetical protein D770_19970 [Flammeovirgaceae bacterium 311]|nr:hypothetical protein D770_19970 [Flammeovirgaceae bacterium 311]
MKWQRTVMVNRNVSIQGGMSFCSNKYKKISHNAYCFLGKPDKNGPGFKTNLLSYKKYKPKQQVSAVSLYCLKQEFASMFSMGAIHHDKQ